MLDKLSSVDKPGAKRAEGQLMQLKRVIDDVIEGGAPGFKQLMAEHAEAMGPVNAQKFLQGQRNSLGEAGGMFTHAKFQGFMRRVVDAIDGKVQTGAEHLSQEQLNGLFEIRDFYRRQESAFRMGRARGESNTATRLGDMATNLALQGARAAGHVGAAASQIPGLANMVVEAGYAKARNALDARRLNEQLDKTYNPPAQLPPRD
jgi:hypothetical protein